MAQALVMVLNIELELVKQMTALIGHASSTKRL